MLDQISVVIITRNAAATLSDTLASTSGFDEVLATNAASVREKLPFPIRHNAVRHLGQFLTKLDRYSDQNT